MPNSTISDDLKSLDIPSQEAKHLGKALPRAVCRELLNLKKYHLDSYLHSLRAGYLYFKYMKSFLSREDTDAVTAGFLHDIGKSGIETEILDKPLSLFSNADYEAVKNHAHIGRRIAHNLNLVALVKSSVAGTHEFLHQYSRNNIERRNKNTGLTGGTERRTGGKRRKEDFSKEVYVLSFIDWFDAALTRDWYRRKKINHPVSQGSFSMHDILLLLEELFDLSNEHLNFFKDMYRSPFGRRNYQ